MGKWLDLVENESSSCAISAISANRSDLHIRIPQNTPNGANGTNGTEQNQKIEAPVNSTPLGDVTAKSAPPPTNLDRQDWADFYEERAAILEHDAGIPREHAERLAFDAAIAGLSWAWPTDHPQDRCSACGSHLGPSRGLPLSDKAVVCNRDCHNTYRQQQRQRAERQLAEWGIGLDE